MSEKVTLIIDGRIITADSDKTILEAALENGIYIPHFAVMKICTLLGLAASVW